MEFFEDKKFIPFRPGSELSSESFGVVQQDSIYLLASSRYYQFYASFIRPRIQMYSGWIHGFHNTEYGVLPSLFLQKIGTGIVNTLFSKPVVFNSSSIETNAFLESKVFKKAHLSEVCKKAYALCIGGGTSLIKLNRDGDNNLRAEALPMNRFFVTVDSYGDIEAVKCFVTTYTDTIVADFEYHLCEERFFKKGTDGKRYPVVHYTIYRTSSNVTYDPAPNVHDSLPWSELPSEIQAMIEKDYGSIYLDSLDGEALTRAEYSRDDDDSKYELYKNCKLLPFDGDLGVRLIKFTTTIPSFDQLPFGQPIADLLMNESYAYDQLKFFERVEVYAARARVMIPEQYNNTNDPDNRKRALDPMVYTSYNSNVGTTQGSSNDRPEAIQPALRASDITTQKQNILNDTAFALNISSSTLAAWLSDGTTQKTATEIEYERSKTESFIGDKISIVREPMQEIVDLYFHYYGLISPELSIMPVDGSSKSDTIQLYSGLYQSGLIPERLLAQKILGTNSNKEVDELVNFIQAKQVESMMQGMAGMNGEQGESAQGMGNSGALPHTPQGSETLDPTLGNNGEQQRQEIKQDKNSGEQQAQGV